MKHSRLGDRAQPPRPLAEDARFAPVLAAFADDATVGRGKMFGSVGLTVNGKTFAIYTKGRFVAKLSPARVDALVATGAARRFDPGHGRLMKQWIEMTDGEAMWVALAREAHAYLASNSADA